MENEKWKLENDKWATSKIHRYSDAKLLKRHDPAHLDT